MEREALRDALRILTRAAWSVVAAFVAAIATYLLTDDLLAALAVAFVAWIGSFGWLLWKLL